MTTVSNPTKRQMDILHFLRNNSGTGCNWAGTPQSARRVLCEKGLINNLSRVPGTHLQWARYTLTELGQNVLMGEQFDKGLEQGYQLYGMALDRHMYQLHAEALQENIEWEEHHGLRYQKNDAIEADVHAVLWKNVEVVP